MAKNVTQLPVETLNTLDGTENVVMFDSAEGKRATLSVLSDYAIKKHTPTGMTENLYQQVTEIKAAVGSPLVANTISAMTDQTKIYVYTGSETGYTAGHWYYYNGTAWADGGVYNSIAVNTDKTLTVSDKAADAKTVGDALETKATPAQIDSKISANIDSTLSTTGKAADAKATGDSLAEKASVSGMVDMAKSLVGGKYTSDKQPYHFRKSPSGGAKDEVIVGGSLGWNQLFKPLTSENWSLGRANVGTVVFNGDECEYTVVTPGTTYIYGIQSRYAVGTPNHKCLVFIDAKASTSGILIGGDIGNNTFNFNTELTTNYQKVSAIINIRSFQNTFLCTRANTTEGDKIYFKNVMLIDLTTLFGTTIADYIYSLEQSSAGAGVAWVKRYIDLDTYHPYDAGSIQSVEGLVSHDVVGFNQWDEETQAGYYSSSNGNHASSSSQLCSKNFIHVLPNTQYCFGKSYNLGDILYYDADKNFISADINKGANYLFTTPSNCHFIQINLGSTYGATYNHDICINISDPSRNGIYEPYEKHSYPLDSSLELRGIPKLSDGKMYFDGDAYQSDGQVVRRYGVVDLGTLTYAKNTASNYSYYSCREADISDRKVGNSLFLCSKYITVSPDRDALASGDKTIASYNSGNSKAISIRDDSFSDASALKTALSGIYLVYEKATTTTETATPYQSPMLVGQTEEYVSDSVVPVGHDSRYYEDITGKVNNLPSDFSTLIAPVEKTFTATRNYTAGSYLILNNILYKVTANIANGGTITPNTNVTATTIMAEIMAL